MSKVILFLLLGSLLPPQATANPPHPENPPARVLVVSVPADLVSRPHDHKTGRVMRALACGVVESTS